MHVVVTLVLAASNKRLGHDAYHKGWREHPFYRGSQPWQLAPYWRVHNYLQPPAGRATRSFMVEAAGRLRNGHMTFPFGKVDPDGDRVLGPEPCVSLSWIPAEHKQPGHFIVSWRLADGHRKRCRVTWREAKALLRSGKVWRIYD